MWPKKNAYKVSVAWNGVKIVLDTEFPILKTAIRDTLRGFSQLELSGTKDGALSADQLTRDLATRQQQVSLLKDADAATSYSASRLEIERTAKLLGIQAEAIAKQAPIVFVGNGDDVQIVDFGLTAALTVAKQGNGEISHQVKALLQMAIESAEAEVEAMQNVISGKRRTEPAMDKIEETVAETAPLEPGFTVGNSKASRQNFDRLIDGFKASTKAIAKGETVAAAAPTPGFKLAPAEIGTIEPPEFDDPEPWKAKRIPFNKAKFFTAQEYVEHIQAAYPGFGTDGLPGVGFDRVKLSRLQIYAHFFRDPESNVVPLHKSDLDGLSIWQVVRKFVDEFFPDNGVDMPAASLRVAAIMSALLDAEDLHEEGAHIRYLYNHLSVASVLLLEEVAEQSASHREEVIAALNEPVSTPLSPRPDHRDPDAN